MSGNKGQRQAAGNGSGTAVGKVLVAVAVLAVIILIFNNLSTAWYVLLVALGFGAVILIHEFGHFIIAKISGIKVEAFSIGFPPTLIGIKKTGEGIRLRVLPKLFKGNVTDGGDVENEGGLIRVFGKGSGKASDTEYRIGIVPFGGFVKMLGQEDTGAAEKTDDPRSFANKPILIRIAVVAAGVIFNAISAFLIFMVVFLVGMDLSPAVVGGVEPDSPADRAGIRPGDRIVEVNSERFVDFTNVVLAPALSGRGQEISFVVEKPDGTTRPVKIVAETPAMAAMPLRSLGIRRASTLIVERQIKDPGTIEILQEHLGIRPGDVAKAVNGEPVRTYWQFREKIRHALTKEVTVSFERTNEETGAKETVDVGFPLYWPVRRGSFKTEFDLCHVVSMVPRIRVQAVVEKSPVQKMLDRIRAIFGKVQEFAPLRAGDIIVEAGEIKNPTYEELRSETTRYKDKKMPIVVLRTDTDGNEQLVSTMVFPKKVPRSSPERVTFGIYPELAADSSVIAATIDTPGGPGALPIPRGARVVSVGGEAVSDFHDIARIVRAGRGKRLVIDYEADGEKGSVEITIPQDNDYVGAVAELALPVGIPFEFLKEKYRASGPIQAISWGMKKTYMFVAQTYVTLGRLITREVSPRALSGPVGIVSMSYKIASQSIPDYIYFLGLISSCIAVMNLLPLPIVDGGVIVLLIVEKIKGSPISPRVQEIISYAGMVFLGAVFLWLTYNDILNLLIR